MIAATLPVHLAFWERTTIGVVVLLAVLPGAAIGLGVAMRVFCARARRAVGPADAGPSGVLQPLADVGRAVQTEDLLSDRAVRPVADGALALGTAAVFGAAALVPVGPHQITARPGAGLVIAGLLFALLGFVALLAAGRWPFREQLLGAAAAVVTLGFALAAVGVDAGTGDLQRVVSRQQHGGLFGWHRFGLPGVVAHPGAAAATLGALLALIGAGPFRRDDVVTGPAGISGLRRWHWSWLRWAALLAASAAFSTWFLGGWALPGHRSASIGAATGWFVVLIKTVVVALLVATTEVAWPRLRDAERIRLLAAWLLPLAGADLLITMIAKAAS